MNVVVYRLPRGLSLSRPGSQCPVCHHPIRWYDNVPVLGWLALGGRCRDCQTWISRRYPLVEALMAVIGGVLAYGSISPVPLDHAELGQAIYQVDLVAFGFRLLLACTLLCAALIEADTLVPPWRLLAVPLAMGAMLVVFFPELLPASQLAGRAGLAASLAAVLVALALGAAAWPAWTAGGAVKGRSATLAALGELLLVAGFLGERAICFIGPASMAVYVVTRLAGGRWPLVKRFAWGAALASFSLAWMLLSDTGLLQAWAGAGSPGWAALVAGSVMFFLANTLRLAVGPGVQPGK
jgi:leader peptidase (prepilin peptidase)/N-methyltransferase